MRVLLDECFGVSTRIALEHMGIDVEWIGDISPGMSDTEVLALSVAEARLLITMDAHFARLVFRESRSHVGVLLIREGSVIGDEKAALVCSILAGEGDDVLGAFSTYYRRALRVRRTNPSPHDDAI